MQTTTRPFESLSEKLIAPKTKAPDDWNRRKSEFHEYYDNAKLTNTTIQLV